MKQQQKRLTCNVQGDYLWWISSGLRWTNGLRQAKWNWVGGDWDIGWPWFAGHSRVNGLVSKPDGCGLAHFSDCVAEEVVAPDSDSIIGQHLWWPIFCGDDGAGGRVGQQVQQSLTVENTHIHRHTLLQCKNINWFSSYIFLHSLGTGDTLPQSLCLLVATFSVWRCWRQLALVIKKNLIFAGKRRHKFKFLETYVDVENYWVVLLCCCHSTEIITAILKLILYCFEINWKRTI